MPQVTAIVSTGRESESLLLVKCDDDGVYSVRRHSSVCSKQHQLCDYLGLRLAQWIHLKVRGYSLISALPEMNALLGPVTVFHQPRGKATGRIHIGTHLVNTDGRTYFGSFVPQSTLGRVDNISTFAGALALDVWAGCTGTRECVFTQANQNGYHEVQFENYRHCFGGPGFTFQSENGVAPVSRQPGAYNSINGWDSFEPYLSRLHLSDSQGIWKVVEDLPYEWIQTMKSHTLERLVANLCRRRSAIHNALAQIRDHNPSIFPNWRRQVAVYGSHCIWPSLFGSETYTKRFNTL